MYRSSSQEGGCISYQSLFTNQLCTFLRKENPGSHPDELTLNFHILHKGVDCCVLPGDARLGNGSTLANGSMVEEGWKGHLQRNGSTVPTMCCHGTLSVPLTEVDTIKPKDCVPSESVFGSIGISIDNTGSVSTSAVNVMSLTNGILSQLAEDGFNIPTWVLTTFNDHGDDHVENTKLVVTTSNIKEMNASLNAIRFSGGGDGPERATEGMLLTLQNLPQHGVVLVFTDHQTKDLDLVDDIIALKNKKDIEIYIALAPSYNGRVGDESWIAYQNISNGNIFNLADFSRDQFISDIVQIIGKSC